MLDELREQFHPHLQAAFLADAIGSADENVESILALIQQSEGAVRIRSERILAVGDQGAEITAPYLSVR